MPLNKLLIATGVVLVFCLVFASPTKNLNLNQKSKSLNLNLSLNKKSVIIYLLPLNRFLIATGLVLVFCLGLCVSDKKPTKVNLSLSDRGCLNGGL